jgi:hypothetical protein
MSGTATALSIYSYPTAISLSDSHLELFALDVATYWKWQNSSTSSWNPQTRTFVSLAGAAAPFEQGTAAVARGSNDVDIFVIGTEFALYHLHHDIDTAWRSEWQPLYGILTTGAAVVSWGPERLDVFALGESPDFELFQISWAQTVWSEWNPIGGSWESFTPTAITWGPNRLDVLVVHPDTKSLHHAYLSLSSWEWENLGGYCTSRPAAVSRDTGVIDIFVRGGDAGLWHLSYQNSWGQWRSIDSGTAIQAEPEAISCASSNIEVFAWRNDGALLHKSVLVANGVDTWTPSSGYEVCGMGLAGPPKAVCSGRDSVDVFAYLENGQTGHRTWNRTLRTWYPSDGFEFLGKV